MKLVSLLKELIYGELVNTSLIDLDTLEIKKSAIPTLLVAINDVLRQLGIMFKYTTKSTLIKNPVMGSGIDEYIHYNQLDPNEGVIEIVNITGISNSVKKNIPINVDMDTSMSISGISALVTDRKIYLSSGAKTYPYLLIHFIKTPDYIPVATSIDTSYIIDIPLDLIPLLKARVAEKILAQQGDMMTLQQSQMLGQKAMLMEQELRNAGSQSFKSTEYAYNNIERNGFI